MPTLPARNMKSLRHLSAAEVAAAMPPLSERLDLAERTMRALGRDAELPPKIGVHPRQPGSLAHAMPALLRGEAADGSRDLIGAKWIAGFPENPSRGLPAYHALVLLNDPITGEPLAVMEAGTITTARTAAISGTAIRHFLPGGAGAPAREPARPWRVAMLGPAPRPAATSRSSAICCPARRFGWSTSIGLAPRRSRRSRRRSKGSARSRPSQACDEAVDSADVVVSMVSFGPDHQALDPAWLAPDALFVAVDYDMQAPAALAREALFVVDERDQFLATRCGRLASRDTRDPDATLGELLRGEAPRRPAGGGRRPRFSLRTWAWAWRTSSSPRQFSPAPSCSDWAACSPADGRLHVDGRLA